MSTARSQGHRGKTPVEIRNYQETVIREQGPTAEPPAVDNDSTDVAQAAPSVPSMLKLTKEPHWLVREWVKVTVAAIVLGVGGWLGTNLWSLNREVGVLTSEIASVRDNIELIRESRREDLERLTGDLGRLERDVDRLQDRLQN